MPNIPDDDPMWDAVAHTLGGLCASLVLVVSPERIILSGGVMNRTSLYPKVRVGGLAYGCVGAGSVWMSVPVRASLLVVCYAPLPRG